MYKAANLHGRRESVVLRRVVARLGQDRVEADADRARSGHGVLARDG